MDFNDFIGNEFVKSQIVSLIKNEKISHAIMIEGKKGLGKRTLSKIISQALICENIKSGFACNECTNCKKAQKDIHPDIIYPEKSGVLQGYSISTVRKIREDAYIVSNEASRKVYIFTDIDNMGIPAQNALLKILEEPPKNVVFILTCISISSVLPTVRSRTQLFSLKPISSDGVFKYLQDHYSQKEKDTLKKIAMLSNGNIGLAIDLMTNEDIEKVLNITKKIAISISCPREFELLSLTAQISENRKTFTASLNFLKSILRDALYLSLCDEENLYKDASLKSLFENLSTKQIINLIDIVDKTRSYLDKNVNLSILSSYFCSNLHRIAFTEQ